MNNEIKHYGVKGMHWGQYMPGIETFTQKRAFKKQINAENRTAHELGAKATVAGKASRIADKQLIKDKTKMDKAMAKDPNALKRSTQKKIVNYKISAELQKRMSNHANATEQRAKQHHENLVKKYGSNNVTSLKYKTDKNGKTRMNERVVTGKDWARSFVKGAASFGVAAAIGSPVAVAFRPRTGSERAINMYNKTRKHIKKNM